MCSAAPRPAFSMRTRLGTWQVSIAWRSRARIWSRERIGFIRIRGLPDALLIARELPVVAEQLGLRRRQGFAVRTVAPHHDGPASRGVFALAGHHVDDVH